MIFMGTIKHSKERQAFVENVNNLKIVFNIWTLEAHKKCYEDNYLFLNLLSGKDNSNYCNTIRVVPIVCNDCPDMPS